jgi:hypothetical protein
MCRHRPLITRLRRCCLRLLSRRFERPELVRHGLQRQPAIDIGCLDVQAVVAAVADHHPRSAELDLQVKAGRHLVQVLPPTTAIPGRQQSRSGVLLNPGQKRLPTMASFEVSRPSASLTFPALGEIDGVRLLGQTVLDLQLGACSLQPEVIPDGRHVAQRGGVHLVDGDMQAFHKLTATPASMPLALWPSAQPCGTGCLGNRGLKCVCPREAARSA